MLAMFRHLNNLKNRDEKGASAVEYGLLVAGIAALVVVIVFTLGGVIKGSFSSTCNKIAQGSSTTASTCAS